ncbi:hypothetical protein A2U01_0053940, partial [Trifolium medium]|nr:hypothetical protein [Trifolium medium]
VEPLPPLAQAKPPPPAQAEPHASQHRLAPHVAPLPPPTLAELAQHKPLMSTFS